jgi:hypothetical protein
MTPKPPLGQRLFDGGKPNPEFALFGTVNWMRALAVLAKVDAITARVDAIARQESWKRETRQDLQDLAFEKLFLAQSYVASIRAMGTVKNPHDVARVAIVAWYYCTYFSSQAMLAITGQPVPEEHSKVARVWLNQFVSGPSSPLVPYPFYIRVSSLVKTTADAECEKLRKGTGQDLNSAPTSDARAHDAHVSYLKGTSGYYREKEEEKVRESREFKEQGFTDFRKKAAQQLRDRALEKRGVGFLDMAFRYRGKANYRDAIFLCYGSYGADLNRFIGDASTVAAAYHAMAEAWVSARVPKADWEHLVEDLRTRSRLTPAI